MGSWSFIGNVVEVTGIQLIKNKTVRNKTNTIVSKIKPTPQTANKKKVNIVDARFYDPSIKLFKINKLIGAREPSPS